MPQKHPEARPVRCRVLTPAGWLEGDFHVPPLCNFLEHLGALHEFEVLTDVTFLQTGHHEPFFDLHRDAIRILLPPDGETEPAAPIPESLLARHDVFCLLPDGHRRPPETSGDRQTDRQIYFSHWLMQTFSFGYFGTS